MSRILSRSDGWSLRSQRFGKKGSMSMVSGISAVAGQEFQVEDLGCSRIGVKG